MTLFMLLEMSVRSVLRAAAPVANEPVRSSFTGASLSSRSPSTSPVMAVAAAVTGLCTGW